MLDVTQRTETGELVRPAQPTRRLRPRWGLEVGLVAVLYVAYDTTRGLRQGNLSGADANGERLSSWEHSWHMAPEHALNQLLWHVPALAVSA
jgi:hypothetical protein